MNRMQKYILWIGVAVICAMLAFPPWIVTQSYELRGTIREKDKESGGYRWFAASELGYKDSNDRYCRWAINRDRLAIQLVATTVIATAAFATVGGRRKRQSEAPAGPEARGAPKPHKVLICPNTQLPEWEELVKGLGGDEGRATLAFIRHGHEIPDVETARKLLGIKEGEGPRVAEASKGAEAAATPHPPGDEKYMPPDR